MVASDIQPIRSSYTDFQRAHHQGSSSTGTQENIGRANMSESGLNSVSNGTVIEYGGNRESVIESQRRKEDALSNVASVEPPAPPAYSDA